MCLSWARHVSHLFQLGETCVSAGRDMCLTFFSLVRHVSHLFQFLAQTLQQTSSDSAVAYTSVCRNDQ